MTENSQPSGKYLHPQWCKNPLAQTPGATRFQDRASGKCAHKRPGLVFHGFIYWKYVGFCDKKNQTFILCIYTAQFYQCMLGLVLIDFQFWLVRHEQLLLQPYHWKASQWTFKNFRPRTEIFRMLAKYVFALRHYRTQDKIIIDIIAPHIYVTVCMVG